MKINEVTNLLKTYIATVHVIIHGAVSTARTTITADNHLMARLILTRLYGTGNVLMISEVVSKSPRTSEIHAHATNTAPESQTLHNKHKTDPNAFSCVSEAGADTRVSSPAELQVKSLSDKAKEINQQAKQLKARQSLAKAQQNLMKASRGPSAS